MFVELLKLNNYNIILILNSCFFLICLGDDLPSHNRQTTVAVGTAKNWTLDNFLDFCLISCLVDG